MALLELFKDDPNYFEVKSGKALYREDDPADVMYVLVEGMADLSKDGFLFEELSPGKIVGEMSVIDGSPHFGTVTAKTDCKFVLVDKKHFNFLVDETPGFAVEVMRVLVQRLKNCDLRFLQAISTKSSSIST